MAAKARITADFATQGDVASRLRIPASRTAELRRQMSDLEIRMADGSVLVFELKSSSKPASKSRAGSSKKK